MSLLITSSEDTLWMDKKNTGNFFLRWQGDIEASVHRAPHCYPCSHEAENGVQGLPFSPSDLRVYSHRTQQSMCEMMCRSLSSLACPGTAYAQLGACTGMPASTPVSSSRNSLNTSLLQHRSLAYTYLPVPRSAQIKIRTCMGQSPCSGIHMLHVKVRRFILWAHIQRLQHRSWYVLADTRRFITAVRRSLKHARAISLHSRMHGTYMTKIHARRAQSAF